VVLGEEDGQGGAAKIYYRTHETHEISIEAAQSSVGRAASRIPVTEKWERLGCRSPEWESGQNRSFFPGSTRIYPTSSRFSAIRFPASFPLVEFVIADQNPTRTCRDAGESLGKGWVTSCVRSGKKLRFGLPFSHFRGAPLHPTLFHFSVR